MAEEHNIIPLNRHASGVYGEIVHDLANPLPRGLLPQHVDVVVHAAGLVGQSANSSQLFHRVNVDATRELVEYAIDAGATRFVFFSTGGIYRPTEEMLSEDATVFPTDAYTESKFAAEHIVNQFEGSIAAQVLRLFFPFGPTQEGRLIPVLIQRIASNVPVPLINAAGQPLVTPLYIDDLVEYIRRILGIPYSLTVNVAGDEAVSILAMATMIGKLLGKAVQFEIGESGATACNWRGSNSRIARLTKYRPQVTFAQGLERTIGQFLSARVNPEKSRIRNHYGLPNHRPGPPEDAA